MNVYDYNTTILWMSTNFVRFGSRCRMVSLRHAMTYYTHGTNTIVASRIRYTTDDDWTRAKIIIHHVSLRLWCSQIFRGWPSSNHDYARLNTIWVIKGSRVNHSEVNNFQADEQFIELMFTHRLWFVENLVGLEKNCQKMILLLSNS